MATTNLWYAWRCESAPGATSSALLVHLPAAERQALVAALVKLPAAVTVVSMRELAWRMGVLVSEHTGVSTLGSEAVAAAEVLGARVPRRAATTAPASRQCCEQLGIPYSTVDRSPTVRTLGRRIARRAASRRGRRAPAHGPPASKPDSSARAPSIGLEAASR